MSEGVEVTRSSIFETVRSLSLKAIVKNFKKYCKYKFDNKINATLCSYCKNILLNQVLKDNAIINLSSFKLSKVYGITHVIIQKMHTKNNGACGLVTESTKIQVSSINSEDFYHLCVQTQRDLPDLGGLDGEFEKFTRLFQLSKSTTNMFRPIGILLHGPPGCGKTSFGKTLAKKCDACFYYVDPSSLLSSNFGAAVASIKDIFKKAINLTEEGSVILFIDEIDMLCPRPESASMGNRQLSSALMNEIDAVHSRQISGLLVLATTNSIASIDPNLRRPRRFDQEILINVPSESQRLSILKVLTASLNFASDVSCDSLSQMTPGFVGADLRSLVEEAINHAQTLQGSTVISMDDFNVALHKTIPSLKKGVDCVVNLKPVKWSEIGSLDEVKAEIRQSIEWPLKYSEVLHRMDIPPAKGILLYGPPGCCKTTLVRAAATSCNVSFLSLSGAQVYSAYVGESEKLISQAFQKARALAPSILFLDEIETLVGKRGVNTGQSRVQERILSTMLNEMDGIGNRLDIRFESSLPRIEQGNKQSQKTLDMPTGEECSVHTDSHADSEMKVIVVGATNRPDMLDPAILRPGRLDKHIYVPPPDKQGRKAILLIYTSKMACKDVDIDSLVDETDLYSGADLKNLCKEAGLQAMRGQLDYSKSIDDQCQFVISNQHFIQALDKVKPSLTREMLQQYRH